jgi:hypothetical protein
MTPLIHLHSELYIKKACVLEFRYRKSTQNLYYLFINRLSSFEPVFNPEFETKTVGLDMGICSLSFTGTCDYSLT